MTEFFLIRHGESANNAAGICTGQSDIPLSEKGKCQAREIVSYFEKINPDLIFSSPLSRALGTVLPLSENKSVPIITSPALLEIDTGKFTDMKYDDIAVKYPDEFVLWKTDFGRLHIPGGESAENLGNRVISFILGCAAENDGKKIVLSTHAVPIRAVLSFIKCGSFLEMGNVRWVKNASVSRVIVKNGLLYTVTESETQHLSSETGLKY